MLYKYLFAFFVVFMLVLAAPSFIAAANNSARPFNPYVKDGVNNEGSIRYSKNGVKSEIVKTTGQFITVMAGVNDNGTVNGDTLSAAVWEAARQAQEKNIGYVDIYIPARATGISAKTTAKVYAAAGGVRAVLRRGNDSVNTVELVDGMGQVVF
jgi:hypothetical protein